MARWPRRKAIFTESDCGGGGGNKTTQLLLFQPKVLGSKAWGAGSFPNALRIPASSERHLSDNEKPQARRSPGLPNPCGPPRPRRRSEVGSTPATTPRPPVYPALCTALAWDRPPAAGPSPGLPGGRAFRSIQSAGFAAKGRALGGLVSTPVSPSSASANRVPAGECGCEGQRGGER